MVFESIAHEAFDSEPIPTRGIIVKYIDKHVQKRWLATKISPSYPWARATLWNLNYKGQIKIIAVVISNDLIRRSNY